MGEKTTINWRIEKEVVDRFHEFVEEHKGQTYGELGREAERALIEYMDRDRYARIEEGQEQTHEMLQALLASASQGSGSHTHTGGASPQTQTQKCEQIAAVIRENNDVVFPTEAVEDAIREIAGASDRTLRDYKRLLKKKGHAYAHPSERSHVWTVDPDEFVRWTDAYIENTPDAHIVDLIEEYPMDIDEFDRRIPV